jgi:hypothetical protein
MAVTSFISLSPGHELAESSSWYRFGFSSCISFDTGVCAQEMCVTGVFLLSNTYNAESKEIKEVIR